VRKFFSDFRLIYVLTAFTGDNTRILRHLSSSDEVLILPHIYILPQNISASVTLRDQIYRPTHYFAVCFKEAGAERVAPEQTGAL